MVLTSRFISCSKEVQLVDPPRLRRCEARVGKLGNVAFQPGLSSSSMAAADPPRWLPPARARWGSVSARPASSASRAVQPFPVGLRHLRARAGRSHPAGRPARPNCESRSRAQGFALPVWRIRRNLRPAPSPARPPAPAPSPASAILLRLTEGPKPRIVAESSPRRRSRRSCRSPEGLTQLHAAALRIAAATSARIHHHRAERPPG